MLNGFFARKREISGIRISGDELAIYFTSGGRVNVTAAVAKRLNLKTGDVIRFKTTRTGRLKWIKKDDQKIFMM
jgi:hypothetical protein